MPTAIEVHARNRNTFISAVEAGHKYRIVAEGQWQDWRIKSDARGFPSPFYLKPFERLRRLPSAHWFALVGFVTSEPLTDRNELNPHSSALLDLSAYLDGAQRWACLQSGSLHVFANDVSNAYRNNKGFVLISICEEE